MAQRHKVANTQHPQTQDNIEMNIAHSSPHVTLKVGYTLLYQDATSILKDETVVSHKASQSARKTQSSEWNA